MSDVPANPTPAQPAPEAPAGPTPATSASPSAAAGKPTINYDDFAKIDLRVATIIAAEFHPKADRLLKLQIDLGDSQRQICAGIRGYYQPEELVGRQIVVVCNLEPRKIRGEESNGMLLAASAMEGEELKDVVLLAPGKPVPRGSGVK